MIYKIDIHHYFIFYICNYKKMEIFTFATIKILNNLQLKKTLFLRFLLSRMNIDIVLRHEVEKVVNFHCRMHIFL